MLQEIGTVDRIPEFIARAKDKNDPFRLMGFGHRVYKNYDPRAKIMQKTCHEVLAELGIKDDPLLDVAMELERIALTDEYFIEKKLYPNIDFYSGITLKALGFPTTMFTVLFAVARTVGWIAQWKEMIEDPSQKIGRPRQLYTGAAAPRLRADLEAALTERGLAAALTCGLEDGVGRDEGIDPRARPLERLGQEIEAPPAIRRPLSVPPAIHARGSRGGVLADDEHAGGVGQADRLGPVDDHHPPASTTIPARPSPIAASTVLTPMVGMSTRRSCCGGAFGEDPGATAPLHTRRAALSPPTRSSIAAVPSAASSATMRPLTATAAWPASIAPIARAAPQRHVDVEALALARPGRPSTPAGTTRSRGDLVGADDAHAALLEEADRAGEHVVVAADDDRQNVLGAAHGRQGRA